MFSAGDAAHLYSIKGPPGVQSHQLTSEIWMPSSKASKYLFISWINNAFFFFLPYIRFQQTFLLSHLYEYLIITEEFGIAWSNVWGSFPPIVSSFVSYHLEGTQAKLQHNDNLLRHIWHSTFSYFLSIQGQKTTQSLWGRCICAYIWKLLVVLKDEMSF